MLTCSYEDVHPQTTTTYFTAKSRFNWISENQTRTSKPEDIIKQTKLNCDLVVSYNIQLGNSMGLFLHTIPKSARGPMYC